MICYIINLKRIRGYYFNIKKMRDLLKRIRENTIQVVLINIIDSKGYNEIKVENLIHDGAQVFIEKL